MAWRVRATRPGLATTYECASAASALAQVRYFARKDYRTLTVTDPHGIPIDPEALEALVATGDVPPVTMPLAPMPPVPG
jgi:cobalamin biosynthesis protein CbiD